MQRCDDLVSGDTGRRTLDAITTELCRLMPIVATAGHVDHGKSTLVQALTGRDPDRWQEEKDRGLTIDLGFAWVEIGNTPIGFVDVPGHERFIKNMLAGIGGLDVALFVVAADEGWMPQSEEHMAVLDLLDVRHGVVALTRIDIADQDIVELATLEIGEHLAGTSLESWPIVPVSAVSGEGMEALRASLSTALSTAGPPVDSGRPRLWVDRSFVIAGAGVVVTGTLLGGELSAGDAVELWPGPQTARIRSLQSHEAELEVAPAGSRVAANLSGLDLQDVARGTLLARPGDRAQSTRFLVSGRPVRGLDAITDRGAYQLHAGSGAWPVRVRTVGDPALIITTRDPIPLICGDRYILRETGRRAVVGGGRILDPRPRGRSAADLHSAADSLLATLDLEPDHVASTLLAVRGRAPLQEIAIDSGGGVPLDAVIGGGEAMHPNWARRLEVELSGAVRAFHEANPLRPGMPKASLASSHGIDAAMLNAVLATSESMIDDGATVRSRDHGSIWSAAHNSAWESAAAQLRAARFAAPRSDHLGLPAELLHAAIRSGRLIRIDADLVYLPEQLDELLGKLGELPSEFTVAEFRDTMEISRRQAVPLLEWLDSQGWTTRRGDVRSVRRVPPR